MAPDNPDLSMEAYYIRVFLTKTKIRDVMSHPVTSIQLNAPFRQVAQRISDMGIRHLPVVDEQNKAVGIITQRDLFKIQPPHKNIDGEWVFDLDALDNVILARAMTSNPTVLHPEDPVSEALLRMVHGKYGCVLVVDKDNVLCGIVTRADLLKLAARTLENK